MKAYQIVLIIIAVVVFVGGVIIYGMRLFNNATTPVTTFSPKPGITCASMVLHDAVAMSCWKD